MKLLIDVETRPIYVELDIDQFFYELSLKYPLAARAVDRYRKEQERKRKEILEKFHLK